MSEKTRKVISIILVVLIILVIIFIVLIGELTRFIINTNYSKNNDKLYKLERYFDTAMSEMEDSNLWDEASIEEYNKLFDGNEHYLHEIDVNTNFGRKLLQAINPSMDSLDQYEEVVILEDNEAYSKDIVIKYSEGTLVFRIPHSNIEYRFWKDKKELEYITHITYVEPHNRE